MNACAICSSYLLTNSRCKIKQEPSLCAKCSKIKSAPQILGTREEENWRGLVTKKHKKKEVRTKSGKISKYLDKNQNTFDAISQEKLKKVPILKNGNYSD